jgi:hypothetical protein
MLTIKSRTSGQSLPAEIVKQSEWRKFLGFRCVQVAYVGSNLKGANINVSWFHEHEIEDK